MSSGGGSRQTTTIEGGTPLLVQDFIPRRQFRRIARYANAEGERAQQALATYQETVNRSLARFGRGPMYDPMRRADGTVVEPFQAPRFINAQSLVPTARELRLPRQTSSQDTQTPSENLTQRQQEADEATRLSNAARSAYERVRHS